MGRAAPAPWRAPRAAAAEGRLRGRDTPQAGSSAAPRVWSPRHGLSHPRVAAPLSFGGESEAVPMRWSYRIGVVAGTEIKVHVTFLLIVAWWALIGYNEAGPSGALVRALALLALFACILLHEFGHILMARRFGVRTPGVILLPIGGVARLERIPDEPRQELLIAIAGPAVTVAIILVLTLFAIASGQRLDYASNLVAGEVPFTVRLLSANA